MSLAWSHHHRGPWHGSIPSSLLAATASYSSAMRYGGLILPTPPQNSRVQHSPAIRLISSMQTGLCLTASTQPFPTQQKKPDASPDYPTTRRDMPDHALVVPSESAGIGPMREDVSLTEPLSMSRSQRPRDVMELAAAADRDESLAISFPPIVHLRLITCPSSDRRLKKQTQSWAPAGGGDCLIRYTDALADSCSCCCE